DESKRLLRENPDAMLSMDIAFDQKDEQNLRGTLTLEKQTAVIQCDHSTIQDASCNCGRTRMPTYWYNGSSGKACAHVLALWSRMRDFIVKKNPGDSTDAQADRLLKLIANGTPREESAQPAPSRPTKRKNVALQARLMQDRADPADIKLGFDIGYAGSRLYGVKGLESLVRAVDEEETLKLTAKASVNFAEEAFNDDALPWYQLILGRVRRVERLNERLRQSYYGRRISAGEGIPMEDSDLDHVYDMTKGGEILYQYGARNDTCPVPVGRAKPRAEITVDPISKGSKLTGVKVSGSMPRLLQGTQRQYILDKTCFGQVDPAEMAILEPFRAIANAEGDFSCVIGEKKFAEFYYRVLPKLQDAGQIVLIDHVGNSLENLVPPEPEFTFYIDLTDVISCKTEVLYAGQTELPPDAKRDVDQENRVAAAVAKFFPVQGNEPGLRWAVNDDDTLVEILTDGVQALSAYGEVKGSDAFRRVHMRPMPAPKVSLRVEGGLLDLSIQTKDYTSDELLDLLSSYRIKKRWHRLKNGDFVDLTNPAAFDELIDTVESMDVSPEQLIREGAQ
ncbi:MAG: SNF2 helicase associated domain-containing protein, partial [bacterium]